MRSSRSGATTLALEVTNISQHGLSLFYDGEEYSLSYEQYPWFRDATVAAICRIEDQGNGHFYWPDLDVDLSLEILRNPHQFPLVANTAAAGGRPSRRPTPKTSRQQKTNAGK